MRELPTGTVDEPARQGVANQGRYCRCADHAEAGDSVRCHRCERCSLHRLARPRRSLVYRRAGLLRSWSQRHRGDFQVPASSCVRVFGALLPGADRRGALLSCPVGSGVGAPTRVGELAALVDAYRLRGLPIPTPSSEQGQSLASAREHTPPPRLRAHRIQMARVRPGSLHHGNRRPPRLEDARGTAGVDDAARAPTFQLASRAHSQEPRGARCANRAGACGKRSLGAPRLSGP
jgi:hypothetical protein